MKNAITVLIILSCCLTGLLCEARGKEDNITLHMSVKKAKVKRGEPFLVICKLTVTDSELHPDIKNVKYSAIPGVAFAGYSGMTNEYSLIGGKTWNRADTYSFYMVAKAYGHIKLPIATLAVGKKTIRSNEVWIDISQEEMSSIDAEHQRQSLEINGLDSILKTFESGMRMPHQPDGISGRYDTAIHRVRAGAEFTIRYHIYAVNRDGMSGAIKDALIKDFSYPRELLLVEKPTESNSSRIEDGYHESEKIIEYKMKAAQTGTYIIQPFHYMIGEIEYTSDEVTVIAD